MGHFLARYRKGIVAILVAAITVITVVTTGGWSAVDWVAVVTSVLGAFGVVLLPNGSKPVTPPNDAGLPPL